LLLDFREVGIRVIDQATLKITLENPTPYFLQLLAFYPLFPVNQRCVEKYGSPQWTYPEHLVSNGAFRLQFRRIRDRIRVVRSDTYWDREHVRLGVVDMLAIDSHTTALNLYLTGELDRVIDPPPAALRVMRREQPPRQDLNPAPFLGVYFYRVNTTRKPLDDVRVRRALSMALCRREITDSITGAGEQPALSLVPQSMPNYQIQQCEPENPDRARALLAEAGYSHGDGFPRFQILYNTHQSHQAIAELIRKQWQQELGISVNTRNEEWASYLSSQRHLDYHLARAAWIGDYIDANTFLDMFVTGGEQNNTGWGNARYDDLIAQAQAELDRDARTHLLQQAERILMDQLPILPIYYYASRNLVKPTVRGFYNNLQDHHPLSAIWIDHQSSGPNEFMQDRP
jgi:oligopeptide transport system substrate-binding protein